MWLMHVIAVILLILAFGGWAITAAVQEMDDEEREAWGHGKRGQGR